MKVSLVGLGYWGPNYLRLLSELESVDIGKICDKDPSRFNRSDLRFLRDRTCSDPEEVMLSDAEAVIIATPASTHFDLALRALQSGKHVLVEKPMTLSLRETVELYRIARAEKRVLMAGLVYLYNSSLNWAKTHLERQRILHMSFVRTGLGPIRTDVNAIWDLAIHDFASMCYLTGSYPVSVWGQGSCISGNVEDVTVTWVKFPDIVATIKASWLEPLKRREMCIVTENEMLVFDDINIQEPVRLYEKGIYKAEDDSQALGFKVAIRNGQMTAPLIPYVEPLKAQVGRFVERIAKREFPLTWEDRLSLDAIAIAQAVNRSIQESGSQVIPENPISYTKDFSD